jgi:cell division protein FtsW (lipid II flippase)
MDLLSFLISITLLGFAIQLGEVWIVFGATLILILSSKDIKASMLTLVSVGVLYFINGAGMKEYWIFAIFGLLILAYIMGLGKEEAAPADPYAGLLGGMGGEGGMGMMG